MQMMLRTYSNPPSAFRIKEPVKTHEDGDPTRVLATWVVCLFLILASLALSREHPVGSCSGKLGVVWGWASEMTGIHRTDMLRIFPNRRVCVDHDSMGCPSYSYSLPVNSISLAGIAPRPLIDKHNRHLSVGKLNCGNGRLAKHPPHHSTVYLLHQPVMRDQHTRTHTHTH